MTRVVVVGAGPGGLGAVVQLVAAGLRPVLIDEQPHPGGQIHRPVPPGLRPLPPRSRGGGAPRAPRLLEGWDAVRGHVDHRPATLVWQIEDRTLYLLTDGGRPETLRFDALILATGATDRLLPFPGWTLPGVVTLGAAQVTLKAQAALFGPRIVFAGTGPLLVLVAAQYVRAGGQVQAVLDVAAGTGALRGVPALVAARPALALQGARMLAQLRRAGVSIHRGVTLIGAEPDAGGTRVAGLRWRRAGREHATSCDAVAFGHGLRSETELADLAGCAFAWDPIDEAWLPRRDAHGRSSVTGVYLAGDGAGIRGADAAELAGVRAAQALLADLGLQGDPPSAPARARQVHERWRRALAMCWRLPDGWAAQVPDGMVVCRCEEVTAGEIRACARAGRARELNRLKALTRIGMGRCQGRMCAAGAARLLADALGVSVAEVGRLRAQPPVKPVPVAALAAAAPPRPRGSGQGSNA